MRQVRRLLFAALMSAASQDAIALVVLLAGSLCYGFCLAMCYGLLRRRVLEARCGEGVHSDRSTGVCVRALSSANWSKFALSLAAYPNPHASPLAQRARKAETGPDAVLKLAQRTRRTTATRTAAGPPAPGRASGVQTATPETSSSGGLKAPPAARERTRMPGTITTRPPEPGRHRRGASQD